MTVTQHGTFSEVALPQGTIRYHERGSGPTLVFIHGVFVNSALWRKVIPQLEERFRCIAPDLPLGGHTLPLHDDAAASPLGVARLIADFLEALDLHDVTLVGNDTGGALSQLVITRHPERISRLVLTNCDAFEQFFPPLIVPLQAGPKRFGQRFTDAFAWLLRPRFMQRLFAKTVSLSKPENAALDTYFLPLRDPAIRRDLSNFLANVSKRYTLDAARSFVNFQHPVLIVWGKSDFIFSQNLARRLQHAFPQAELVMVEKSRAFVPEDQPEFLAQQIANFVHVQS